MVKAIDESLGRLAKAVEMYDAALAEGWRDDIDKIPVFSGLFSAVVTAFLIESYKKLEQDPAEKTVLLLEQLVLFQRNASLALAADPIPPFQPDSAIIRINCFWFLSLIFSLISAVFGLLCREWIRGFEHDTPTNTTAEALALRQLRRDSFEKWHVPSFLAALPILVELALILFFMGILDLLWRLHRIPFIVALVAVGLSAGLYFATTLLPALTIPKNLRTDIKVGWFERLSYQFICPYKSPQAWVFYRVVCTLLYFFSRLSQGKRAPASSEYIVPPASDWSSLDLRVVRQYDQQVRVLDNQKLFNLQVYQLRAFEWAVTMFRDSPSMIPHLQNVLETIPPPVAMSAVLGRRDIALWTDVSKADVDLAVQDPEGFRRQYSTSRTTGLSILDHLPRLPAIPDPVILQPEGIKFLFKHQMLMMKRYHKGHVSNLSDVFRTSLEDMGVQTTGFHFIVPLSITGRLWTHQNSDIQKQSLALLTHYHESWNLCSKVSEDKHSSERLAFVLALARHINRTDHTSASALITSRRGQEFMRFINQEIITQALYNGKSFARAEWVRAIERTREAGKLSSDYFAQLPGKNNPPPNLPPLPPTRSSVDTQADVVHDNQASGSQRDGGISDDENSIQIVPVPNTADKAGNSRNLTVQGRGHTTPQADDSLIDSDEPRRAPCTDNVQSQATDTGRDAGQSSTDIRLSGTAGVLDNEQTLAQDHDSNPLGSNTETVSEQSTAWDSTADIRNQDSHAQPITHPGSSQLSDGKPTTLLESSFHSFGSQSLSSPPDVESDAHPAPDRRSSATSGVTIASDSTSSHSEDEQHRYSDTRDAQPAVENRLGDGRG
ncbi:hypothetical protein VNI00_008012 [Paramarasmius palmivorus]|uniref:DUF6535 domain-containing protein n=1 Tax=Paramarasmius palmivorus TaxID=297713 RepID=A0AAW0CYR0_9AGAR